MKTEYSITLDSQPWFPPPDAVHFENSHWVPELNLVVIDVNDVMKTQDEDEVNAYNRAVQLHEIFHTSQGRTGAIFNRMGWFYEAVENLMKKPDINDTLKHRIAIDKLHLQTLPLLEAEVALQIDEFLDDFKTTSKVKPHLERSLKELQSNKERTLQKSEKVSELYKKLRQLYDMTDDYRFVYLVCRFALDIPYLVPEWVINSGNPYHNPVIRFEESVNALESLNKTKPLKKRENFARFITKKKVESLDFLLLLNSYTGIVFGPTGMIDAEGIEKARYNNFKYIQLPEKYLKKKSSKKTIENYEKDLMNVLGVNLFDFHKKKITHNYLFIAYKFGNSINLIPNYNYQSIEAFFSWEEMYLIRALVDCIATKSDKETLLRVSEFTLPKYGTNENFKNNINRIFKEIDYSKVNPVIFDEFKETSKLLGRELNWN